MCVIFFSFSFQDDGPNDDDTEEEEIPEITLWEAITWLAVLTIWISVLSEYLVNAIEVMRVQAHVLVSVIQVLSLPFILTLTCEFW